MIERSKKFYSNIHPEELSHYCAYLGLESSEQLNEADDLLIDLEKYIFQDQRGASFAKHNWNASELKNRYNSLLSILSAIKKEQERRLFVPLVDLKTTVPDDIFLWSYYNHKFAASKGKDTEAMEKWHKIESQIGSQRIAEFKKRTESNLELFCYIIEHSQNFSQVLFGSIDPVSKKLSEFGHDISEEKYLRSHIEKNNLEYKCLVQAHNFCSPLLNFGRRQIHELKPQLSLKAHIVSNSKKLEPRIIAAAREIFAYLKIQETELAKADFVLLINDLDLLSGIPLIETESPILVADFSLPASPNFPYILLKDPGFDQIYSFAKARVGERYGETLMRSILPGLFPFYVEEGRFVEQIAVNYMDDYFAPLSKSLGKGLKEFIAPISLLSKKLETK